jgi:hypothetical protein
LPINVNAAARIVVTIVNLLKHLSAAWPRSGGALRRPSKRHGVGDGQQAVV